MVQLALIGTLLCNVLIAWATLHKPFLYPPGQSLSSPPPQNKNKWVHPVIFEPQPKIQLTQSPYKITSFLDFQPFLKGFQSVFQYLEDLMNDLNNPKYLQRLIYIRSNSFRSLLYGTNQLSKISLTQKYVNIIPLDVNQNLNLNSISWKSNILIKCFIVFIENFLQP